MFKFHKLFFISLIIILNFFIQNLGYSKELSKTKTKTLIYSWVNWLNIIGLPNTRFSENDLAQYYAPNIEVYTNGKLVAKGYADLYKQYEEIRIQYTSMHITLPLNELLVDRNKVALSCVITLTAKMKQHINDLAIVEFDNKGKIVKLWELLDSKDPTNIQ
ncbi:hypothetical protein [Legionella sp. 227]|uniref:hypothetical protein n=1 Tax=Legionella sp. 227 TaxID=3367288 RepID=UPI00370D4AA9